MLEAPNFLRNFSASRAFYAFAIAFALGTLSIYASWGPWVPALPVVLYGLMLLVAQVGHFVSLEDSVKDSPYFLGFLLTLAALLKALAAMGADLKNPSAAADSSSTLLAAASAAIVPTVAGLFMRQALLS